MSQKSLRPCQHKGTVIIYRLGGGGAGILGVITWFEGEQKGGSAENWEPVWWAPAENQKGEVAENFGRIQGGPLKFAWKMKTWGGGSRKTSNVIGGDPFTEVKFKEGIG